jgi:hypothetical protein
MTGLQKLCKMYGRLKVDDVMWVWDYANDKPRLEKDMTPDEMKASEKAKWEALGKRMKEQP